MSYSCFTHSSICKHTLKRLNILLSFWLCIFMYISINRYFLIYFSIMIFINFSFISISLKVLYFVHLWFKNVITFITNLCNVLEYILFYLNFQITFTIGRAIILFYIWKRLGEFKCCPRLYNKWYSWGHVF